MAVYIFYMLHYEVGNVVIFSFNIMEALRTNFILFYLFISFFLCSRLDLC